MAGSFGPTQTLDRFVGPAGRGGSLRHPQASIMITLNSGPHVLARPFFFAHAAQSCQGSCRRHNTHHAEVSQRRVRYSRPRICPRQPLPHAQERNRLARNEPQSRQKHQTRTPPPQRPLQYRPPRRPSSQNNFLRLPYLRRRGDSRERERSGRRGGSLVAKRSVRPDITFIGRKLAIFVHGCFWHRCPTFLSPKVTNNKA